MYAHAGTNQLRYNLTEEKKYLQNFLQYYQAIAAFSLLQKSEQCSKWSEILSKTMTPNDNLFSCNFFDQNLWSMNSTLWQYQRKDNQPFNFVIFGRTNAPGELLPDFCFRILYHDIGT